MSSAAPLYGKTRASSPISQVLAFDIFGQRIRVGCDSEVLARVVLSNFDAFLSDPLDGSPADLQYLLTEDNAGLKLTTPMGETDAIADIGDLLYELEHDLTLSLQRRRSDLLFLHAAALEYHGKAYLVAGDSGSGKSTAAWGLLHHGFGYLSDELSPIELQTLEVLPYPHALSLKRRPPAVYPLPQGNVLAFDGGFHVPASALPAPTLTGQRRLAAVLFVRYQADAAQPSLRALEPAEASVRLYVATLNALAHAGRGLDAVMHIARNVPCFSLNSAELRSTCELIGRWVGAAHRPSL